MKTRRKFTREFKLSVLKELEVRPPSEICKEYEIHPTVLNRWKFEYKHNPTGSFSGNGTSRKSGEYK